MPSTGSQVPKLHRAPLIWLAAVILMAAIAGCVVTIVLAQRHPDETLSPGSDSLLGMPLSAR